MPSSHAPNEPTTPASPRGDAIPDVSEPDPFPDEAQTKPSVPMALHPYRSSGSEPPGRQATPPSRYPEVPSEALQSYLEEIRRRYKRTRPPILDSWWTALRRFFLGE